MRTSSWRGQCSTQWTQRTSWRGQWPAEEGGTELEAEVEEGELAEEGKLAEEGELAGAAELEAEEGELEGPVQHAMDTEDELEGSVQRSHRLARLRKWR